MTERLPTPAALQAAVDNIQNYMLSNVRYDLKNPCSDCPFMNTTPFHQGVAESIPQYIESIEAGRFAHTCHKTDNRPECDGPHTHKGATQHCLGALLMLLKTSNSRSRKRRRREWNWIQRGLVHALDTGKITDERFAELVAQAKARKDVFTVDGLISFYVRGIEKLVAEADAQEVA